MGQPLGNIREVSMSKVNQHLWEYKGDTNKYHDSKGGVLHPTTLQDHYNITGTSFAFVS